MTAQDTAFGLSRIGQIAMTTKDLDRAVKFYRDILGLKLLFQAPPGMAFFDCGPTRLMIGLPDRPELDHPSSILYFTTPDIKAAHATLLERGVKFEREPLVAHSTGEMELWLAFFHDMDGNLHALMSEVAKL